MKSRQLILVVIVLVLFNLVSCKTLDFITGKDSETDNQILGRWVVYEVDGERVNTNFSENTVFDFKDNGKILVSFNNEPGMEFKYELGKKDDLQTIRIIAEQLTNTMYGIYKFTEEKNIQGPVLVIKTRNKLDGVYPTDFEIQDGYTVEKYKRLR